MKEIDGINYYSPIEEKINIISHAIVFAIKPIINNLPLEGLLWLFAGGISYTIGAILYSIKKIEFNHAIFHMFVLIGSFCHFMSVFFYVLPNVT